MPTVVSLSKEGMELSQEQIYQEAGLGASIPRGRRPAIVVVDFTYGFTDPQYPTSFNVTDQIVSIKKLCDIARDKGFPVIFTTIAYQPGELDMVPWLKKAPGLEVMLMGSRLVEIDSATGIQPGDPVLIKKGASSFFGTTLTTLLSGVNTDTVIVCGAATSGCVRATVVDAVQSGFNVLVPEDCCADRTKAPHDANLFDMGQKYADVTSAADIENWLHSL